jgi:P27 family predicted phage terminase small subunit
MSAEDAYERKRREPHSPDTAIVCPPYVTLKRDQREFERYAEMLDRLHVWSELDADELARYVMAEHSYEDYMRMLRKAIHEKDTNEASRIQRLEIAQAEQARKSASALGMNITSRCKLVVPTPNDDESLDV